MSFKTPFEKNSRTTVMTALNAHPSTAKVSVAMAAAETASNLYQRLRKEYAKHVMFTLTITEGDALYQDVHNWILTVLPEHKHRKLKVAASSPSSHMEAGDPERSPASRLNVYFDDSSSQTTTIEGHRIKIFVIKPDRPDHDMGRRDPDRIMFQMTTRTAQQAVLRHIESLNRKRQTRRPVLKMVGRWGDTWTTRSDLPARSMDSVIIPKDQKQSLIDDLENFLDPATEEFYVSRGMPYHRGYMLHGPAGTGKTTIAKALANRFNLDLWCISLAELREEASLMNLISQVPAGSLLLLEDIDSAPGVRKRKKGDKKGERELTPQSLLNALDGVATPHGLITIMTTNHFEWLDKAMTRAGRMDRVELIDLPTVNEIAGLLTYFYKIEVDPKSIPDMKVSQALVSEICKRNMHDLEGALTDLKQLSTQE